MRPPVLLLLAALPALAQEPNVQRELIQRQQQSDSFNQQLRQSQERLAIPPDDVRGQQRMDARQLSDKQNLENLNAQQLRDTQVPRQLELRPYEREKAAAERRPFMSPIVEIPVKSAEPPAGRGP